MATFKRLTTMSSEKNKKNLHEMTLKVTGKLSPIRLIGREEKSPYENDDRTGEQFSESLEGQDPSKPDNELCGSHPAQRGRQPTK